MSACVLKRFSLIILLLSSVSVYPITYKQFFCLATALALAKGVPALPVGNNDVTEKGEFIYIDTDRSSGSGMPSSDLESSADDAASSGRELSLKVPSPEERICDSLVSVKSSIKCVSPDSGDKEGQICMTKAQFELLKTAVDSIDVQANDAISRWGYWKKRDLSCEEELKRVQGENRQIDSQYRQEYNKHAKSQKRADEKAWQLVQCNAGKKKVRRELNKCQRRFNKGVNIQQPPRKSGKSRK